MRRIVLLGAVTPIVALGFFAVAETVLFAQTPKPESSKAPAAAALAGTESAPIGADLLFGGEGRPSEVNAPALDANPLRQRFIELSKKKAYALNEVQLKVQVESMESEVRELEAWAKAQEAVRLLHEVIEKHPNTKAAVTANAAIQLIEQRRDPAGLDSRRAPIDSESFERPASRRSEDDFQSAPRDKVPPERGP
jgi:ribosomal protein L31E